MSNYEFWKDLGKIFNAVVAYQEKSIEFNKRFINPWIKIGNVFDTQDRHREAVRAFQQAIEIDPDNAQNWLELGNAHFRNEAFDDAITAYQKAIELDPNLGWPYSNLALTYVVQNRHAEAKLLYEKSIQLLSDDKDKAISWNRLGNLHRKLNEYDLAMLAFQKADELDKENAGFKDEFDEVIAHVDEKTGVDTDPADMIANSIQLIVEQNQPEEKELVVQQVTPTEATAESIQPPDLVLDAIAEEGKPGEAENVSPEPPPTNLAEMDSSETLETAASSDEGSNLITKDVVPLNTGTVETSPIESDLAAKAPESETTVSSVPEKVGISIPVEKIETLVVENDTETFTASLVGMDAVTETFHAESPAVENITDPVPTGEELPVSVGVEDQVLNSNEKDTEPTPEVLNETIEEPVAVATPSDVKNAVIDQVQETAQEINIQSESVPFLSEAVPVLSNVEMVIKDNDAEIQPAMMVDEPGLNIPGADSLTTSILEEDAVVSHEPITMVDESGEFQLEMDTKNAHVWNELGNVYFNRGAIDDAIVAYSKAIELDRWFAWPYSNLALAYVQKERFAEAMLLYQRSIELFSSNKDKAISWNRLGNVYRRLNDYDNAIASYQRADELDPDNSTIYLQSRFSLLGNYQVEQNASISS